MKASIDFFVAKKRLATFWFILVGIIFFLMMLQTISGKYEDKVNEAWGWIFPSVLPTLSLMLSTFLADVRKKDMPSQKVDPFYFKVTLGLSLFYLLIIISIILFQPFTEMPIVKLMKESNIFLGPFQGLVSASMGLFFIKKG